MGWLASCTIKCLLILRNPLSLEQTSLSLRSYKIIHESFINVLNLKIKYDLTFTRMQTFCSTRLKIFRKKILKLDIKVENIVENCVKGEIAHYRQLLLFSQCFKNRFTAEVSESLCMWEKGLNYMLFWDNLCIFGILSCRGCISVQSKIFQGLVYMSTSCGGK